MRTLTLLILTICICTGQELNLNAIKSDLGLPEGAKIFTVIISDDEISLHYAIIHATIYDLTGVYAAEYVMENGVEKWVFIEEEVIVSLSTADKGTPTIETAVVPLDNDEASKINIISAGIDIIAKSR